MRFGLNLIVALGLVLPVPAMAADPRDASLVLANAQAIVSLPSNTQPLSSNDVEALRDRLMNRASADDISGFLWSKAQFEIDINPEARLSVWRTETPLSMPACGGAVNWLVRIDNDSHVTSAIHADLTSVLPTGSLTVELAGGRLSGATHEFRWLRLGPGEVGPIDVTLSVKFGKDTSDLVNRGEVPLLLLCGGSSAPGVMTEGGGHHHH